MTKPSSFALDVAAPSLRADRDAPWIDAFGTKGGDKALAAVFWASFHGLSLFAHGVAIFLSLAGPVLLAIVPIPFLAAMCVDVKPVVKPLERVELSFYVPPPPEAPPEIMAPEIVAPELVPPELVRPKRVPAQRADMVELVTELEVVEMSKAMKKRKKAVVHDDVVAFGMIGLLSANEDMAVLGALTADQGNVFGAMGDIGVEGGTVSGFALAGIGTGVEGGVVGGVIGGVEGGTAVGGVGVGLGGGSPKPHVTLDGASPAQRDRLARALSSCAVSDEITGTLVVQSGTVTSATTTPANACVARLMRSRVGELDVDDGAVPFVVTPAR